MHLNILGVIRNFSTWLYYFVRYLTWRHTSCPQHQSSPPLPSLKTRERSRSRQGHTQGQINTAIRTNNWELRLNYFQGSLHPPPSPPPHPTRTLMIQYSAVKFFSFLAFLYAMTKLRVTFKLLKNLFQYYPLTSSQNLLTQEL